jgi:CheY-like chemotaxis protein
MPQFVSATQLGDPGSRDSWFDVVARLRPGVTLAQAQAEMDVIARLQAEQYPETNRGREIRVVPLLEHIGGESRNGLWLLSVGTAMLLLIACSNVATLLLARGLARRREVAIRTALGAPRWRIVRQFLMEALILAACAGLLGVLLAAWAINVTRPWMPQSLPLLQEMGINLTVLLFALTSVVFTAWHNRPRAVAKACKIHSSLKVLVYDQPIGCRRTVGPDARVDIMSALSEAGPTPQPEGAREPVLVRPIRSVSTERPPKVIFCTAYDQFAVQAFELNAVDYLLKPVTRARLAESRRQVKEAGLPDTKKLESPIAAFRNAGSKTTRRCARAARKENLSDQSAGDSILQGRQQPGVHRNRGRRILDQLHAGRN